MKHAGTALRVAAILVLLVLGALMVSCPRSAGAQTPPRFIMACAPCHGFDGVGHDPATPNLASQNVIYLYNQMMAFRSGTRKHPEMNFFSGQMTLEEMQAIAIYYAALPR